MKNKTKNRIRFFGFTLVEMLIVVVILGILSATLLPKVTGYMARTRDLKRQMDLRTIATAIEMYQQHHQLRLKKDPPSAELLKRFPGLDTLPSHDNGFHQPEITKERDLAAFGSVKYLSTILSPYLAQMPKDPLSNSHLRGWNPSCWSYMVRKNASDCPDNDKHTIRAHQFIENGEYLFIQLMTAHNTLGRTLLIAKMETPDAANRVGNGDMHISASWGNVDNPPYYARDNHYHFKNIAYNPKCATITKGEETRQAKMDKTGKTINDQCVYVSPNQLYYILEI